jgi:hypothetical protein
MSDLLYHGTNVPQGIFSKGVLKRAPSGYECVSLSRSYEVAAYFATMERDEEQDEALGGILVFSRARLIELGYELIPFHDTCFGDDAGNEEEEQVWADIPLDSGALLRIDLIDRNALEGRRDQLIKPMMADTWANLSREIAQVSKSTDTDVAPRDAFVTLQMLARMGYTVIPPNIES